MDATTAQLPKDDRIVNAIRCLCADTVQAPNSGHPGAPMGCAAIAYTLFSRFMVMDAEDHKFPNRDRFVLSNGHASSLLYAMLYLRGFLKMKDLEEFRKMDSLTPGHPENHVTKGVEVTTGPLGQGICNAVGMAISRRIMGAHFNTEGFPLFSHNVYVLCGDGCLQEGVSGEASSLAGHLGLGELVIMYDDNQITIDGPTSLSFSENVAMRYEAYGWQVLLVSDGNNVEEIDAAIRAGKANTAQPTLIVCKTRIGYGSAMEGTAQVHGTPLGEADIKNLKTSFGMDPEKKFTMIDEAAEVFAEAQRSSKEAVKAWRDSFEEYRGKHPEKAAEFERRWSGAMPADWAKALGTFTPEDKPMATRAVSEAVLNQMYDVLPELLGGSADLTPSNKTSLKKAQNQSKDCHAGRYLRFGVREHAMASICNGIAAYGGALPFCATFMTFAGYALGAMRLSALSRLRVIYILTHDSIGVGEDGPTHQPVETLLTLRSLPNMTVLRPADANEVVGAYIVAGDNVTGPSALALSRQNLPQLANTSPMKVSKGGYVVHENSDGKPELILVASGSEVHICVEAAKLMKENVRVVSMPCWKLFDAQPIEYRRSVLGNAPVVSVEAGVTMGWGKYAHVSVGIDTYGASAPAGQLFKRFGMTAENVVKRGERALRHFKGRPVPVVGSLLCLEEEEEESATA